MHLGHTDVGVPVGDRSGAGRGGQVYTGQAKCRRDQRPGLLAVGPKGFPILVQKRIVAARSPAGEHFFHGCDVHPKEVRERLQVWRQ